MVYGPKEFYMDSYMAYYIWYVIGCHNLFQVHLQEVGLTQIPANHASDKAFEKSRVLTIT